MYLQNCQKLTTQNAFERVASFINESYYALDWDYYDGLLAESWNFHMSILNWETKLKTTEKTYKYLNKPVTFREYAIIELRVMIENDWQSFSQYSFEQTAKVRKQAVNEFLARVKEMKRILKMKPWLATIYTDLEALFNEIIETYTSNESELSKASSQLRWNGQLNQLTTMLLELTELNVPNKKERYLSASPQELTNLVLNNFVDEKGSPFAESSVITDLTPTRIDKRVTDKKKLPVKDLIGPYLPE